MRQFRLPLLAVLASALAAAVPAAQAASDTHQYAIGGVTAERSSMVFVDLGAVARAAPTVRAPILLVQRDARTVGAKTVLYSAIDIVFDCRARTMSFMTVKAFAPDGALVETISTPGPALPMPPGSSFAATADVACSGQPRAADAPSFSTDKLAVDYAQRLLHGQRPSDRAL
jgi:hypothetical protein